MSKILDSLKKADNIKNGKNGFKNQQKDTVISSALNKEVTAPQQSSSLRPPSTSQTNTFSTGQKKAYLPITIVSIGIFLLLITNLVLIGTVKNNAKTSANTTEKLNRIEGLLNKNGQQLIAFSSRIKEQDNDLSKVGRQMQSNQDEISQLEKRISSQATTINGLNSAKKTLLNRVSALEANQTQAKPTNE